MNLMINRQKINEKIKRKHTWLGILCSLCMVFSLVFAVPITASAEGETEITSVTIEVDFLLRKNKNFTNGEVVAADRSKYKIIKQGWYKQGDDPLQDPACSGSPEIGTDYFYFVQLERIGSYRFPNSSGSSSGNYDGIIKIESSGQQFVSGNPSVDTNILNTAYVNLGEKLTIRTHYISLADISGGSSGEATPTNTGTSHTHSFAWRTITEPTAQQDGLEAYACTTCGYYEESVPISAYSYACDGGTKQIISAAQGAELTLDMGVWCAYPKWFMQKLADRRDLTIRLRFEYEHQQYEVTIPAGAVVDTECDWYGPLKLCSLYPYTVK